MIWEKSCGAVVFTCVNGEIKYVLAQSRDGVYGFPKGHVEKNESEKETALREIFEEVGLRPTILDGFRTTIEYPSPVKKDALKQVVFFLAEFKNQEVKIQEEELRSALLVSFEEGLKLLSFEITRNVLREANEFLKNR